MTHFDLFQTLCDVNRFGMLLTVKCHFRNGERTDESVTDSASNSPVLEDIPSTLDCVTNEFDNLLFKDQMSLVIHTSTSFPPSPPYFPNFQRRAL